MCVCLHMRRVRAQSLVEARLVHTIRGHEGVVVGVDFHPTESCLLSASVDGTARVWK